MKTFKANKVKFLRFNSIIVISQSEMATASPLPQVSTPAPAAVQVTPVKAAPTKATDKKTPKPKTQATPKPKAQARRAIKPKAAGVGSHPPYGDMYVPVLLFYELT